MNRIIILVLVALVLGFVLGRINTHSVSSPHTTSEPGDSEISAAIPDEPRDILATEHAISESGIEKRTSIENDLLNRNDMAARSHDESNDDTLSFAAQEFIQAVTYETVAGSDISAVAYVENVSCTGIKCAIAISFTEKRGMSSRSAALMSRMNARLEENTATNSIQIGLTLIAFNENGGGQLQLTTMAKPEHPFVVEVNDDGSFTVTKP